MQFLYTHMGDKNFHVLSNRELRPWEINTINTEYAESYHTLIIPYGVLTDTVEVLDDLVKIEGQLFVAECAVGGRTDTYPNMSAFTQLPVGYEYFSPSVERKLSYLGEVVSIADAYVSGGKVCFLVTDGDNYSTLRVSSKKIVNPVSCFHAKGLVLVFQSDGTLLMDYMNELSLVLELMANTRVLTTGMKEIMSDVVAIGYDENKISIIAGSGICCIELGERQASVECIPGVMDISYVDIMDYE